MERVVNVIWPLFQFLFWLLLAVLVICGLESLFFDNEPDDVDDLVEKERRRYLERGDA